MIILTVQTCYNVFALLWSAVSLLLSGPIYLEISDFVCNHQDTTSYNITPICYEDQCEGKIIIHHISPSFKLSLSVALFMSTAVGNNTSHSFSGESVSLFMDTAVNTSHPSGGSVNLSSNYFRGRQENYVSQGELSLNYT